MLFIRAKGAISPWVSLIDWIITATYAIDGPRKVTVSASLDIQCLIVNLFLRKFLAVYGLIYELWL